MRYVPALLLLIGMTLLAACAASDKRDSRGVQLYGGTC